MPDTALVPIACVAVAIVAGIVTPDRPMFTALVLGLGTPWPFGHAPFSIGLLPIYAIGSLIHSFFSQEFVREGILGVGVSSAMLCCGLAVVYGPYWLLVKAGRFLRTWLSRMGHNRGMSLRT
ncbi:MAG: hypothetical protein H7039_10810 [Bryobacteraceae bacterium]|nr:hypothetical protein [Bryobacteraceae bacterium]